MAHIYTSADQLIGHTPLLELVHLERAYGLKARILAKLEYFNPAGSVKDRIAKAMIDDAEAAGKLKPGSVIIEPTSGNTGIGLTKISTLPSVSRQIFMPDSMSVERRQIMQAYGAELILTPGAKGMAGAIEKAQALAKEIPGAVYCETLPDVTAYLRSHVQPGDLVLTIGAGDIFRAGEALLKD